MTINDPYGEWNLDFYRRYSLPDIERVVSDARAAYIERVDRKLSSCDEWVNYVQLLHIFRLLKRESKRDA